MLGLPLGAGRLPSRFQKHLIGKMFSSVFRASIQIEFGRSHMSDWIDNLKQSEETKERAQRQREEWALRCDHLISAKARDLWQGLVETLEADVSKLCEAFRNQDAMHVAIQDKGENYLTVRN